MYIFSLCTEKSKQAHDLLNKDEFWLFLTCPDSDSASSLVFDASVSGLAAFMLHPNKGVLALVARYDEGYFKRLVVFDEIKAYERSIEDAFRQ